VCKRWRGVLEMDGLAVSASLVIVNRVLRSIRPERLASLTISCICAPRNVWRELEDCLAAAAPRLRSSFRLTLTRVQPPLVPYNTPACGPALISLLTRHSALLHGVYLELNAQRGLDSLFAWLRQGPDSASRDLLPLFIVRGMDLSQAAVSNAISRLPTLRDHLVELCIVPGRGEGAEGHRISADAVSCLSGLRDLEFNYELSDHTQGVALDANICRLSNLRRLAFTVKYGAEVELVNPEKWLARAPSTCFPSLEVAALYYRPSLSRLLPAFHNVTRLTFNTYCGIETLRDALGALTRLRELRLSDGSLETADQVHAYCSIPFPPLLRTLEMRLVLNYFFDLESDPPAASRIIFPSSAIAHLAALSSLVLDLAGCDLELDPPPYARRLLTHLTVKSREYILGDSCVEGSLRNPLAFLRKCPRLERVELYSAVPQEWSSAANSVIDGTEDVSGLLSRLDIVDSFH
jgi:hypothetical protein